MLSIALIGECAMCSRDGCMCGGLRGGGLCCVKSRTWVSFLHLSLSLSLLRGVLYLVRFWGKGAWFSTGGRKRGREETHES